MDRKKKKVSTAERMLGDLERLEKLRSEVSKVNEANPLDNPKSIENQRERRRAEKNDPLRNPEKASLFKKRRVNGARLFVRGIYYLYDRGAIVYIGMSTSNCMARITAHFEDGKKFDYFRVDPEEEASEKQLLFMKNKLVRKHRPKYNKIKPKRKS